MGTSRRAYDLLRGYVNHHVDRIRELDADTAARDELEASLRPGGVEAAQSPSQELPATPVNQQELARKILGVEEKATFAEIRKAYERLCKRSDPQKFVIGSEERKLAEDLHARIETAYRILSAEVPAVEKRFNNLELD